MPRKNLLALVVVLALTLVCWRTSQGAREKDEIMEMYGLFVDAVEQVEANYVRPVTRRELIEGGLRGMCEVLDQHSSYINTRSWQQFRRQLEGSFGGLGIQVDLDDDTNRLKVIAPMVGTPAYRAGILAGDVILEVDGKSTEGVSVDAAVEMLQGRPGTNIKLKVAHRGGREPQEVSITRAIIDVPSVMGDIRKADDTWDYIVDKDNKIGYVRITSFIQRTAEELAAAVEELQKAGMQGLIIDLRDNPGGLLSSAVEISDIFVEDGPIVSTKGRNVAEKVYKAKKDGTLTGFPIAVLINGNSASASEIVSACLQDKNRAKVVGQRSFGKGSVQNIIELEDGESVLKLTVATYWRPSGKNIHRFADAKETDEWGVSPNAGLEVKLATRDYREWAVARRERDLISKANPGDPKNPPKPLKDPQMQKALEIVRADIQAAAKGKDKAKDKDAAVETVKDKSADKPADPSVKKSDKP